MRPRGFRVQHVAVTHSTLCSQGSESFWQGPQSKAWIQIHHSLVCDLVYVS